MKEKTKLILAVIILFIITGMVIRNKYYKNEIKRINNNYQAEKLELERVQELTKKELKKYEIENIELAKKLDIKIKNVKNIIVTKYNFVDTVVTKVKTVYDTIKIDGEFLEINKFDVIKQCYNIAGYTIDSDVVITDVLVNDKLSTFIYKDYKKKLLFIKWKSYYTTKVFSECKNDIVKVEKNIKIIKKRRLWKREK